MGKFEYMAQFVNVICVFTQEKSTNQGVVKARAVVVVFCRAVEWSMEI